jgi:hypothetical protein
MKRAEKIKLAQEQAAAAAAAAAATRDETGRDEARREWGQVRKAAREAFMAKGDWGAILNAYKDRDDAFYTYEERSKMVKDYSEELIGLTLREAPPLPQRRPQRR